MPPKSPRREKATRRRPATTQQDHVEEPSIVIEPFESMAEEEGDATPTPLPEQPSQRRPDNPRCCTDPTPGALSHTWSKDKEALERPRSSSGSSRATSHRNPSPYSRSHLRSRSTGASSLSAPLMTRAHSLPNPHLSRPFEMIATTPTSATLSPSPLRSPARARSPFKSEEGAYNPPPLPRSPHWFDMSSGSAPGIGIEVISEDSELDLTPRALPQQAPLSSTASFSRSNSLRSGRQPSSPLHSLTTSHPISVPDQNTAPINPSSASSSPALNPQKYNEAYPIPFSLHHYASNSSFSSFSMPSTPTSARSRSPSISSLDTIEDAPEEETEAEAEAMERLKLAADSESDGEGDGPRRRSSLDVPRSSRRIGLGMAGERKRWSIAGGERRGDLDLETIWED